jgi:hypothetical protein
MPADGSERPIAPDEPGQVRNLIVDELGERLERFRLLGNADEDLAEQVLAAVDVRNARERELVAELAARKPLDHPERFEEAHRLVMHALEVLDRHGWRSPRVPNLGPLTPAAETTVEWVARYIVRSYIATVIDALRNLYGRREAQSREDDPARRMLRRARLEAERLTPGYKGNPIGLPTFLLTGATISLALNLTRSVFSIEPARTPVIVGGAILFVVFGLLSFVLFRGAAVARRRSTLVLRKPLDALWETVGHCGRPPRDDSILFAWVAILLTALGWLLVPLGIGLAVALL